jgi:protein TonB
MDVMQPVYGGGRLFTAPFSAGEVPLKQPGEMSRAFLWAVVLHLAAAPGLLWVVKNGHGAVPVSAPVILECDVTVASQAPVPSPAEATMLAQAVAVTPREFRDAPVMPVPSPRVASVALPVPIAETAVESSPRLWVPDLAGEDTRALAALPFPAEGGKREQGGRPMALSEIRPHYPYAARTRGQEGSVTVHLRVTPEGGVDFTEIARSSGVAVLDQSAMEAARKATFKPAERDGRPVSADMDLQFVFRLED